MRSVYFKILACWFVTLVISLGAFMMVTRFVSGATARGNFITDVHTLQTAEAEEAYEARGPAGLAAYLKRLHRFLRERDYVTDSQGKDLITGEDRSALLKLARPITEPAHQTHGQMVFVTTSGDGKIRLISTIEPPIGIGNPFPFYGLIFVAVALVCWMLAVNIASPLRELARAVERFGRSDLSVRLKWRRKEGIGELSRSFDRMAERIGMLMTGERRLLQDVSHELRPPLARLSFAVELVRTAADRDAAVERMKKEIDRLADLVSTLLEVTRAEGDPSAARLAPLRLSELLQEVVADCRIYADARGCGIHMIDQADATLRANPELLRRAFDNVVRNAIRYTPEGAIVDVRTEAAGSRCVSRCGIRDWESRKNCYQKFFSRSSGWMIRATARLGVWGLGWRLRTGRSAYITDVCGPRT